MDEGAAYSTHLQKKNPVFKIFLHKISVSLEISMLHCENIYSEIQELIYSIDDFCLSKNVFRSITDIYNTS